MKKETTKSVTKNKVRGEKGLNIWALENYKNTFQ